jgi:competence protein CoiA
MQRYAITSKNERIEAIDASSQVDYFCPECAGIVRVKRGEQRQAHFFHRSEGSSCRIRFKNSLHKAVQAWIIEKLGPQECTEECFFPDITRIADVAYHKQQIVFEVQLSPISATEALKRTFDYYRIGWHVIWILHAHAFGRYNATPFEEALEPIPHYFTDIGYAGGRLWDEGSYVHRNYRIWLGLPPVRRFIENLEVLHRHLPIQGAQKKQNYQSLSSLCQSRKDLWPCHLKGDLLETFGKNEPLLAKPSIRFETWKRIAYQLYFWYLRMLA